jgi:hypothetical protein
MGNVMYQAGVRYLESMCRDDLYRYYLSSTPPILITLGLDARPLNADLVMSALPIRDRSGP